MGTKLYVGNLSYDTTEADLRSIFEKAGAVAKCELIMDKFTSRSRGFAFVEMASQADTDQAIEKVNGQELDGRKLRVSEARPREDAPPRRNTRERS